MKDIRDLIYKTYYSNFKKGQFLHRLGLLHLKLWFNEKYRPLLRDLPNTANILEIGCGSGEMLWYLKQLGFDSVTGIDISQEQVQQAKINGHNAFRADALSFLEEQENQYDAILAIDVVEHFKKEELAELLQKIYHALKPGGTFIVQTPNGSGLMPGHVIYGDLTHFTILNDLSLRQIFTITGFQNIKIKELGFGFFIHLPFFIIWQFIRMVAILVKFFESGRIHTYWTQNIIGSCQKPSFTKG